MSRALTRSMLWLLAAGVFVSLLGATWAWQRYEAFQAEPLAVGMQSEDFRVKPGDSVRAVLDRLERRGLTENDWRWRVLLWLDPATIQVGEYSLRAGTTPRGLLRIMEQGDVIQYQFTVVEGWNYRQLRAALLENERLSVAPEQLAEEAVMAAIGSEEASPEGWFLPETYAYTAQDDALDLLRRAHGAMQAALAQAWDDRAAELPLDTPYELLTLASIVEKESSLEGERPEVAGVFVRRLEQGWRLETDPTVIYGLGERYDGDIRSRDLREDTPWNTYVHQGLPPTPIAMPGARSLMAVARPASGTAMFFVADGRGGHVFSENYADHKRAVQDLIRRQRAARDRSEPDPAANAPAGEDGAP